jgi:hypothetical protein
MQAHIGERTLKRQQQQLCIDTVQIQTQHFILSDWIDTHLCHLEEAMRLKLAATAKQPQCHAGWQHAPPHWILRVKVLPFHE